MIPERPQVRRRNHPAQHARRVTGTVAAGSAIALFGWFGVTTDATASTSASTRTTTPAVTGNDSTANGTAPSGTRSRRSANVPATPSTTPRPVPNTHPYTRSGGS
jgi:hypothetical protein